MIQLGIDLGGTKTEIIALDESGGELLRYREPTPQGDYQGTIKLICNLVESVKIELDADQVSIGIGVPGSISPTTGLMRNANSTCLNGRPLQVDLEQALKRKIVLANDANCFALSEATDGAGAGASTLFAVIIGTGTGAGLAVDGKVIGGLNSVAGEWGHNPLPWPTESEYPGQDCWCGLKGCIETWLSGPGMLADHLSHGGTAMSAEEVVSLAEAGDYAATSCLERYVARMAKSLAHVINLFDPEVIVLGGGMSNVEMLYDCVPELWSAHVFSDEVRTKLLRPVHGDSSGVRGAAWIGRSI